MAGVDCTYLPLFEMTYKECERLPSGRPYSGMNFFVPPRPSLKLLKPRPGVACCAGTCTSYSATWQRYRRSASRSSVVESSTKSAPRLGVTVDLVHLGPKAADELADMVHDFVRSSPSPFNARLQPQPL